MNGKTVGDTLHGGQIKLTVITLSVEKKFRVNLIRVLHRRRRRRQRRLQQYQHQYQQQQQQQRNTLTNKKTR